MWKVFLLFAFMLACEDNAVIMAHGGSDDTDDSTDSFDDSGDTFGTESGSSEDSETNEGSDSATGDETDSFVDTESVDDTDTAVEDSEDTGIDTVVVDSGSDSVSDSDSDGSDIDTGSDSGSDSDVDTDTGSDTGSETDTVEDTDTGIDTGTGTEEDTETVDTEIVDTEQVCIDGGVSVGGYCWYMGEVGESCSDVCGSHGDQWSLPYGYGLAYEDATMTYVGSLGGWDNSNWKRCRSVLTALGNPNIGWGLCGIESVGCVMNPDGEFALSDKYATTADAYSWMEHRRACACEGIIQGIGEDCDGGRMFYREGSYNRINGLCWATPLSNSDDFSLESEGYVYCEDLEWGGHDDWRRATSVEMAELFSFNDGGCKDSYPCQQIFGDDQGSYWVGHSNLIDFSTGEIVGTRVGKVACVRGKDPIGF